MALSLLTTPVANQTVISAALWIAEFNNIYNNSLSLISPLAGDLAFGGNKATGLSLGTVGSCSISATGNADNGIYFSDANTVDIAANGVRAASFATAASGVNYLSITPSATTTSPKLTAAGSDSNIDIELVPKGTGGLLTAGGILSATFKSTDAGNQGPRIKLLHDSASPAIGDINATIDLSAKDNGGTERIVAQINSVFDDVTSTTMDSHLGFAVMNNVNAGPAATTATLSSLGVWTDASAADIKEYIGDVASVFVKAKQLKTLGVYRGKGLPQNKHATAETHYSPTAEEFYQVFGLGVHPSKTQNPGIAPKDVAWLAIKMALELDGRLTAIGA